MIALALAALAAQAEEAHYAVDYLVPPPGEVLEVGGMAFLGDGSLAVSTRRGRVWIVEDPLARDPAAARFRMFADGLHEGLGLNVVDGELLVLQRGELSRLRDTDGDGRCDRVEVLANDWGLSGNYHEFAFGLPRDGAGNLYLAFNIGFFDPAWWHGQAEERWRGWVMRYAPDGGLFPFASGFRSPSGLGIDLEGRLLVTDNQGDWIASSPIHHVREGGFHGHPASLDWDPELRAAGFAHSDTEPTGARERTPPAIWIPYEWSRSTGNLVADDTGGAFGPFGGQVFVAELTLGRILRAQLEEVRGVTQGAVFPFRHRVGAACRVGFAPDGTLFVGMTNRGWGGLAPNDGIARVRYTGAPPFAIERARLLRDGFELTFTRDLPPDLDLGGVAVECRQYDYEWWWEYGSPEKRSVLRDAALEALPGSRRALKLSVDGLAAAMCARVRIEGLVDAAGAPLLHGEFAYTINQLPEGPLAVEQVAKVAAPPAGRQSPNEGWLWLTWLDAFDSFLPAEGWLLRDAELDPDDPTALVLGEGDGALVNLGSESPGHYTSRYEMGDGEWRASFYLPQGGRSGLLIQGRYELVIDDSPGCGRIAGGKLPDRVAYRGPGEWHELRVRFRAPRFEDGVKVTPAMLESVQLDGLTLHDMVRLDGPTPGAVLAGEAALGPLVVRGDSGAVGLRGLSLRAKRTGGEEGWSPIFDGATLDGWRMSEGGAWTVEDGAIVGRGARSHLFSPRGDYRAHEVRIEAQINDRGNSGLYARALYSEGWPDGYEAQINSTFGDPQRTGSLYGLAPVRAQLIEPGVWFEERFRLEDVDGGTRLEVWLNGVKVAEHLDREGRFRSGHVALQQHHEGSEVRVRRIEVRELDR